jgi:ABC-type nitrate/sulfonate/bicarbonate transport system permease component
LREREREEGKETERLKLDSKIEIQIHEWLMKINIRTISFLLIDLQSNATLIKVLAIILIWGYGGFVCDKCVQRAKNNYHDLEQMEKQSL